MSKSAKKRKTKRQAIKARRNALMIGIKKRWSTTAPLEPSIDNITMPSISHASPSLSHQAFGFWRDNINLIYEKQKWRWRVEVITHFIADMKPEAEITIVEHSFVLGRIGNLATDIAKKDYESCIRYGGYVRTDFIIQCIGMPKSDEILSLDDSGLIDY